MRYQYIPRRSWAQWANQRAEHRRERGYKRNATGFVHSPDQLPPGVYHGNTELIREHNRAALKAFLEKRQKKGS